MKNYNYKRTTAKVRQPDGSYKYKGFYGKTGKELTAKVKAAQEKAEAEYQKFIQKNLSPVEKEYLEVIKNLEKNKKKNLLQNQQ